MVFRVYSLTNQMRCSSQGFWPARKRSKCYNRVIFKCGYYLTSFISLLTSELQNTIHKLEQAEGRNNELRSSNKKLASQKTELEKKVSYYQRKSLEQQEAVNRLKEQVRIQAEENRGKSKALGMVNDEVLALQMENNLLNDKVKRLETENEHLVVRWMNKVKEDAEKLNDANAFLETVKGGSRKA